MPMSCGRPSSVTPMLTTLSRSVLLFELLPVALQLLVVRQAIIVADVEPEMFLRRGDGLGLGLSFGRRRLGAE